MSLGIGCDVGGSTVRVALVDDAGEILVQEREKISDHSPGAVLDLLARFVESIEAKAGTSQKLPMTVGFAGQLLVKTGTVAVAPNFGWRDVPMGALLEQRFGRPVRLVNDLDAITFGEARLGAGRGTEDVLCVFVGTGVGMGALVQGIIVEGADGLATELGHTKIASPVTGRRCGCGERGCLEAYTGGRNLPDLLAAKVAEGAPSPLYESVKGDLGKINAKTLEAAAVARDPGALALWDDVAERLGFAIGNMVTVLNPHVCIVGGGVLGNAPTLLGKTLEIAMQVTAEPARKRVTYASAALGDDAGLVGAGLWAARGAI